MEKASFVAGRAYSLVLMAQSIHRELASITRDEESLWQVKALLRPSEGFEFDLADALEKARRQIEEQMKSG